MPPKLNPHESKVDGLAFLGLSLSRKSAAGHPESVTHQTSFDLNEIQDRDYEYIDATNDDGWLAGGGEPGPPRSYKLAAADSAHVEIMRIGTYDPDWGGITAEDVVRVMQSGRILIPQIEVLPTAVVANPDTPPELEIRFDMEPSVPDFYDCTAPLPVNWSLRFIHNQLFRHFKFASRFCPGPFHSTILRKAQFRSSDHETQYFEMCDRAVNRWRERGPQPLNVGLRADLSIRSEATENTSGLCLFLDRKNITHFFPPNFLPPYDCPQKHGVIMHYLKEKWDDDALAWEVIPPPLSACPPPCPRADRAIIKLPEKLNPEASKVDGLAFLGLSLARNSAAGHPESVTYQTAFDLNEVQDRDYKYLLATDDNGWLVGGGEPGPPRSYKLAAADSAHVEIMRIGTYAPEWGGVTAEDVVRVLRSGKILIPQIEVLPTAVVANWNEPPELEIRFDMEPSMPNLFDCTAPLPVNWSLRFIHNQLFRHFKFASRFCPGAFHSTILRKAEFRSPEHEKQYFEECGKVVKGWREKGPQPLNDGNWHVDESKRGEATDYRDADSFSTEHNSGLWLFQDRNTITDFFPPNFLPPYDTPHKYGMIMAFLNETWDVGDLEWKNILDEKFDSGTVTPPGTPSPQSPRLQTPVPQSPCSPTSMKRSGMWVV